MLFLFSNNNFDKYAKEELENIFTPETRVLCFSGSDIRWQIDNREELLQSGKYYEEQYAPFKRLGIKLSELDLITDNAILIALKKT